MATNHQLHRRHMAVNRRYQPARPYAAGKVHTLLQLEEESSDGERRASLKPRQAVGFGTDLFPPDWTVPLTDLFPPAIPSAQTTTTPTTAPTPSSATTAASTTISETSTLPPSSASVLSTTTTAPPTTAPTTVATTVAVTTSQAQEVVTSTQSPTIAIITSSVTRSSTTSAASASTSTEPSSGAPTGAIVGGSLAGIAGIVILAAAVAFIVRKMRGRRDSNAFDPNDFRRSAMLMPDDPPMHNDTVSGGFSPRPPSMVERHAAVLNQGYGQSNPQYGWDNNVVYDSAASQASYGYGYGGQQSQYPANYGTQQDQYPANYGPQQDQYTGSYGLPAGQYQAYSPSQYVEMPNSSANPFMTPAPYEHSPFSPVASPVSAQAQSEADIPAPEVEPPSTVLAQVGGAAVLTRSVSSKSSKSSGSGKAGQLSITIPKNDTAQAGVVGTAPYPTLSRQSSSASASGRRTDQPPNAKDELPPLPLPQRESIPPGDYADLSRSSISPFQAAQYVEIYKRLKADVPKRFQSSIIEEQPETAQDRDLPALPPPSPLPASAPVERSSPFDDPASSPATVGAEPRPESRLESDESDRRFSGDSLNSLSAAKAMDFPIPPPSPVHTVASRYRIDSLPPTLPEISVESRVSVGSYSNFEVAGPPRIGLSMAHGNASAASLGSNFNMAFGSGLAEPAFPSGITAGGSPFLNRFPATPSPLGASFTVPSPEEAMDGKDISGEEKNVEKKVDEQKKEMSAGGEGVSGEGKERRRTVYSMYDPEDAYGGI